MYISKKSNFPSEIRNSHGEILQEILGLETGGIESHSLARVVIPPGKASLPHFHKVSEESYLILSGIASLKINHETHELGPGEAILIEPYEVHQILNQTNIELSFIAVCVPAWQPEDSFEVKE